MYRQSRTRLAPKAQRTRFGLSGNSATLEPSSLGDRARLVALHALHVEGRDLEQARTDKGLRFGKQQPNSPQPFATHFVQRDGQPIQCLAHTTPTDAQTCEIDVNLNVVTPPPSAPTSLSSAGQDGVVGYVLSTVVEALNDAKSRSAQRSGSSEAYIEDALLVPPPAERETGARARVNQAPSESELVMPWADAHRVVLALLANRDLAVAHPHHLPRCVDPDSLQALDPASVPSSTVAKALSTAIAVEFSSDLHGLGRVLGVPGLGSLRRWMAGALARERGTPAAPADGHDQGAAATAATVGVEKKSTSLRLEWVQEGLQRAIWATGVKVRANSEEHSPRADVQRTSEEQARRALDAIASLWESLAGGAAASTMAEVLPCGGIPRLTIQTDQHFVFLRIRFGHGPKLREATAESDSGVQRPGPTALALAPEPTSAVSVAGREGNTPALPLTTASATLFKRGLPHDFVVMELRDQLEASRDHAAVTAGIDPEQLPPVTVLVRGVMSRHGESVQRVKLTNVVPGHVSRLAARLDATEGIAALDTVDSDADPALSHFRRAAQGARPEAGKLAHAPDVRSLVVWKPNGLLHASRRDGFVALSSRRRKGHRNDPSRNERTGGVRAQQRDATPATVRDADFWNTHSYSLYDVRDEAEVRTFSSAAPVAASRGGGDGESRALETTMRLGDLWGYHHKVTLRNIIAPSDLDRSLQSVASSGFVNYFGPQRFTTETQRGMFVGLQLLRGEFRGAANVLVDVGDHGDFHSVDMAGGGGSGFSSVRRDLVRLLRSTADGGGSEQSCRDAFLHGLGPVVTKRFVNESLCAVWNSAASARLKRHGPVQVLEGDIVRPRPPPNVLELHLGRGGDSCAPPPPSLLAPDSLEPVFVTKADVAARRFTIHDVVLPIPGAGVVVPRNDSGTHTIKMLSSHGLHAHPEHGVWTHFVAQGNPLGVDVIGGYRYLLERPLNFSWAFGPDEADDDEAATRKSLRRLGASWARRGQSQRADLRFDLPASVFSWSLLREVARSNVVSDADVNRSALDKPNEVDRDAPTKRFSGGRLERSLREQVKKPRDHYGTDLMAIGKIEAQIFAKSSVDGAGPLADPRVPVGRQSAGVRIGRGKL